MIDLITGVAYKQYWLFRWKQAELSDVTGFVRFEKDDALYSSIYSLPLALFTRPSPLAHYATTSSRHAAGIRLTPDLPLDGRDLALFREQILPRLADMTAVHSVPGEEDGGDHPTSSDPRDAS